MGAQVSKLQCKTRALRLFHQTEAGSELVAVADHGQPKWEVCSCKPCTRSPLDMLRGSIVQLRRPINTSRQKYMGGYAMINFGT